MADSDSTYQVIFQTSYDGAGANELAASMAKFESALASATARTEQLQSATLSEEGALRLEADALAALEQHLNEAALGEARLEQAAARAEAEAIQMATAMKESLLSTLPAMQQVEQAGDHMVTSAGSKRRALFALSDAIHGEMGRAGFEVFELIETAGNGMGALATGATPWLLALTAIAAAYKLISGESESSGKAAKAAHAEAANEAKMQEIAERGLVENGYAVANQYLQEMKTHITNVDTAAKSSRDTLKEMNDTQAKIDSDKIDQEVAAGTRTKESGQLENARIADETRRKNLDLDIQAKKDELKRLQDEVAADERQRESMAKSKDIAGPETDKGKDFQRQEQIAQEQENDAEMKIKAIVEQEALLEQKKVESAEQRKKIEADVAKEISDGDEQVAKDQADKAAKAHDTLMENLNKMQEKMDEAHQKEQQHIDEENAKRLEGIEKAGDKLAALEDAAAQKEANAAQEQKASAYERRHGRPMPRPTTYTQSPHNDDMSADNFNAAFADHGGQIAPPESPTGTDFNSTFSAHGGAGPASPSGTDFNSTFPSRAPAPAAPPSVGGDSGVHEIKPALDQNSGDLKKFATDLKGYTDQIQSTLSSMSDDITQAKQDIAALQQNQSDSRTS